MALYEYEIKPKVLLRIADVTVELSGDRYKGLATIKIVECSPANSILLVVPTVPEEVSVPDDTVFVDMISVTERAQLKPDQLESTVVISESPRKGVSLAAHTPAYTLTMNFKIQINFWQFMAAYTNAMLSYGNYQAAFDDMVSEFINEDEEEGERLIGEGEMDFELELELDDDEKATLAEVLSKRK
ncbi:hypothetical protein OH76DRAFT_1424211 [Lentinus brumalis]|uniref:Uncharacterized protein n=1 Tax=Lentinus brumalis TaxID=2498619 RepID=A0A371CH46_9APHY|nr:hypothetical protein OH76DRAFT_1424211 [Polyporus brumalis]